MDNKNIEWASEDVKTEYQKIFTLVESDVSPKIQIVTDEQDLSKNFIYRVQSATQSTEDYGSVAVWTIKLFMDLDDQSYNFRIAQPEYNPPRFDLTYFKVKSPKHGVYYDTLYISSDETSPSIKLVEENSLLNEYMTTALYSTESYVKFLENKIVKMTDIKYIGVPNICFSITEETDKRESYYKKQRIQRGFDDSETWSLRDSIANFIIPRLEVYNEFANEMLIREPELVEDINYFLESMKLIAKDDGNCVWNEEEQIIVVKGLNAFPKIFLSLWW